MRNLYTGLYVQVIAFDINVGRLCQHFVCDTLCLNNHLIEAYRRPLHLHIYIYAPVHFHILLLAAEYAE